jgi:predicted  nucleic acid-binding Zn-ribbon protein
MNDDLRKLVELQEIDFRIQEQELSSKEFPEKVTELEGETAAKQERVDAIVAKIESLRGEEKSLQEQVVEANEALEKSRERLNTIKTNREYDAVHAEIESKNQTLVYAEGRSEQLVKEASELEESLKTAQEELEAVKTENDPKVAELKGKIATIGSRIDEIMKERNAFTPQVPKQHIRSYEYIRRRRKTGHVLSRVKPGDRTCSVCFKVLESQLVNEIRSGRSLIMCQSCGSILIWDDSPAEDAPEQQD